jgi:UrcA family protein
MSTSRLAASALLAGAALAVAVPAAAQDYSRDYPADQRDYPADQRDYPAYQQGYANDPDYRDQQEDIVVEGRWGRVPDDVESLSQRVSYADLDLSYSEDRRELRRRVDAAARYLCDRLGEDDSATSYVPSCRQSAVRDAMRRVGTIEAHWAPRGTGWVRPTGWREPDPYARDDRYP